VTNDLAVFVIVHVLAEVEDSLVRLRNGEVVSGHLLELAVLAFPFLHYSGLQGMDGGIQDPGRHFQKLPPGQLRHLVNSSSPAIYPSGGVGRYVVNGGARVDRRNSNLADRNADFLGHNFREGFQCPSAQVHKGGKDVHRSIFVDLDNTAGIINRLPGERGSGPGGVEAAGHA
jgi:hypothetical protein